MASMRGGYLIPLEENSADKIFGGQNFSVDKIFGTNSKFRQFCPPKEFYEFLISSYT